MLRDGSRSLVQALSTSRERNPAMIATPVHEGERSYRGFNLFHGPDLDLFRTILRGEFTISGFQVRHLRAPLVRVLRRPALAAPQAPPDPWLP